MTMIVVESETVTEEMIAERGLIYLGMTLESEGIEVIKKAKQSVVRARNAVELRRKKLKAEAVEKIDGYAAVLQTLIAPIELHLTGIIHGEEQRLAKIESDKLDAREKERCQKLDSLGDWSSNDVRTMSDNDFIGLMIQVAEQNRLRRENEALRRQLPNPLPEVIEGAHLAREYARAGQKTTADHYPISDRIATDDASLLHRFSHDVRNNAPHLMSLVAADKLVSQVDEFCGALQRIAGGL